MSILSLLATRLEDPFERIIREKALGLVRDLLVPEEITREVVERYIRKALRTGAWRSLRVEARALLLVLRRFGYIRSLVLKRIVQEIFLEVEFSTLRGKALFFGVVAALKRFSREIIYLLRDPSKLLVLGIEYMNTPLIYRV